MKYSSRFFLYAPFGLFLAIALGVGIHWWLAASAWSARLAAMNGREIAPGVTMRFASRTIAGFPFNLDTVFRGLALRIDTPHGPTEWRSEEFAMHALTYGRNETIFEAAGKQELRWTKDDGGRRALGFAVGSLRASAIEDRTGLARFDLDLVGFGSRALTAQRLQLHTRRMQGRWDLLVEADDIHFSQGSRPDLGDQIAAARLTGTIDKAEAFDALRAGAQTWFGAAERWRRAGGAFHADSCSLLWSGLSINGKGLLALDETHRPQGVLGFDIGGFPRFLQRAGRLPRGPNSGLAGALLDRRADASGHANAVLAFRNGIVMLGGEPADTLAPLY
jgi:hypothetical protein